ncbi:MAG: DsbA family protein [Leptospirales bacterium]
MSNNKPEKFSAIWSEKAPETTEIIYVGDPMCSWCWGISPALIQLRDHFAKEGITYKVIVGGLRPGGGDPWNDQMKTFLKHHWEQVTEKSGQPFGYKLFDLESFNYDTEPSCRAIVAARPLVGAFEMEFFEAVQRKFYVESEDPSNVDFYETICQQFEIDFSVFKTQFESDETKEKTNVEFDLNRKWGVQGYPAVLLSKDNQLQYIAQGFSSFDSMKDIVNQLMNTKVKREIEY